MNWEVGAAGRDCLSLAIAFHQAPGHFPELLRGQAPLPSRMTALLRLAAGLSADAHDAPALPAFVGPEELKTAARFFVEHVLLARDADHYRILGVNSDASLEEIKEHHRLLMRVFHPDRSQHADERTDAIAARINLAYNALRLPADRAAYDLKRRQASKPSAPAPPVWVRHEPPRRSRFADRLPPFVARRLPQFVLGGFALLASFAVALVYMNRESGSAIGGSDGNFVQRSVAPLLTARIDQRAGQSVPDAEVQPATNASEPRREPTRSEAPPAPPPEEKPSMLQVATARLSASVAIAPDAPTPPVVVAPPSPEKPPVVAAAEAPRASAPEPVATERSTPVVAMQPVAAPPVASAAPTQAPTSTQESRTPPPRRGIGESDLVALVANLSDFYERGELERFLDLFADGARIERGGKGRIRSDYQELFRTTDSRQLVIWDMKWVPEGDLFRGEGNYQARVLRKGEDTARIFAGKIKLEAVDVNGTARLRGMFH